MKKIKLFLGDGFYSFKGKVFFKGREIFNQGFESNSKNFSLLILYARRFNLKNLLSLLNVFSTPLINDVVVVVGNEREEQAVKEIKFLNGKVVVNPDPQDVLYSSLKIGLKVISKNTDFLIVHFGTLYNIKKETVNSVIKRALSLKKDVLIPSYKGRRGHPVVFSRTIFPLLTSLRKEKGLPYLLKHYRDRVGDFSVSDKNILRR